MPHFPSDMYDGGSNAGAGAARATTTGAHEVPAAFENATTHAPATGGARAGDATTTSKYTDVKDLGADQLLIDIANYVVGYEIKSRDAVKTARFAILDFASCALRGACEPACAKLLGPVVPGVTCTFGAHVPGTEYYLDPVTATGNMSTCARWLDYNDAFYGAEWTHPSDCIGAVLAVAEYVSRLRNERGLSVLSMRDVIVGVIKTYEIVGILALDNSFNQIGVDHGLLTRVAVAAVTTSMLGGGRLEVMYATSQAFIDGSGLRCFRHYPCAGTRKGWAAGDAASRGVSLALMTMRGEMGYLGALTAPVWGFNDVFYRRQDIALKRDFGEYVMENIVFKPSYPSEVHAQTAIEASFRLHPQVVHRVDEVHSVAVHTTRSAVRCIDKTGPLNGPADRDHCLQYAVAVALLYGNITTEHYEDSVANDPRVDELRRKILIAENPQYSADYVDPDRRSCSNSVQVHFKDRTSTNKFEVEYPVGHRRRRMETFSALEKKFIASLHMKFPPERAGFIFERVTDAQIFDALTPIDFMELFNATPHPVLLPPMRAAPGVFDYTQIDTRASVLVPRLPDNDARSARAVDDGSHA